jgi:hypothetical protein
MRNSPLKAFANSQGLSPTALKDKRARDLAAANSPARKAKRAENQRLHRANPSMAKMDYDHKDSKFKTVKANRGNDGKGTKNE